MIRVLRLLEYTYETNERAELDMQNWEVPASGSRNFGGEVIRSSVIVDLNYEIND